MSDRVLRLATLDDDGAITALIDRSVRGLQADDYSPEQINAAIGSVFGVDRQLIRDQSYFVVEEGQKLIACGGWSRRRTLYGGDDGSVRDDQLLDPSKDAARVRAFFVDPDFARQGLGSMLLDACEEAATRHGFARAELGATLTGVPLYTRHGFSKVADDAAALPDGSALPIVLMSKALA